MHCPEGICVLFIYGAERQEGEVRLVECWGGYEMIEDVCLHVCNSLGWVEGLGGGGKELKNMKAFLMGSLFSLQQSAALEELHTAHYILMYFSLFIQFCRLIIFCFKCGRRYGMLCLMKIKDLLLIYK